MYKNNVSSSNLVKNSLPFLFCFGIANQYDTWFQDHEISKEFCKANGKFFLHMSDSIKSEEENKLSDFGNSSSS